MILHPKVAHKGKTESEAKAFGQKATEQRGSANRTHRNTIVCLAAVTVQSSPGSTTAPATRCTSRRTERSAPRS